MPRAAMNQRRAASRRALAVAALYAAFGSAWILWSDRLLFAGSSDLPFLQMLGQWKGFAFVALSAALLYAVAAGRPASPRRGAAPATDQGANLRLAAVLALAAVALTSAVLAGAASAVRNEREEATWALAALVDSRVSAWPTRQEERDDAADTLLGPLDPAVASGPDAPWLRRVFEDPAAPFGGVRIALLRHNAGAVQLIESTGDGQLSMRTVDAAWWPASAVPDAGLPQAFDAEWPGRGAVVGVVSAPTLAGWSVAAHVERAQLHAHAWNDVLWLSTAAMAVFIASGLALFGLHQHRELVAARQLRAGQEERLRALGLLGAIADGTPDVIFAKDLDGRFLFANRATCLALGQPIEQVIGRTANEFFGAEDQAAIGALHAEVLRTGQLVASEGSLTTPAGLRQYQRTLGPLRDEGGRIYGVFGVVRDVTEHKHQQQHSAMWAQAFESTRDGVLVCDASGRIERINRAFTEITGYEEADVIGRTPALLRSGRHEPAFYTALWRDLLAHGVWRGEVWNRRKGGEIFPEWLTINVIRDGQDRIAQFVGVFTDISRVKQDEARLEQLAHYDPLTELPNRRLLKTRLAQALDRARHQGGVMALLSIDLDGFKTVNDSLGHPAGDELLLLVAQRLKHRLRAEDTLGRMGGDEFLVIAQGLHQPADAAALAQNLLAIIGKPVRLSGGTEAYVTASIGISLCQGGTCADATAMLRDADTALFRAKEQGRNRFVFYSQDMNEQAMAKLEMEAALSHALHRNELRLHYQPKFSAETGHLTGAEALLRWQRDGVLMPPGRFIPLAESSSLILDIGAWVIDEACRQWRCWADEGLAAPCIAVNVAARQFSAGDLDRVVASALQRHGVPPACLELELTESMLIDKPDESLALLRRLKDIGVSLALDDFGTGYSNLAYLRQFPIDALKIDQSFVALIGEGGNGSAIVDAVIGLAHRLGLSVVAEGVETEQQKQHQHAQGCDELQGFGVGRPVPAQAFASLYARPGAPGTAVPAEAPAEA
jgi:diguanylate cyclase (GGDEF)-like protein/PAS domain S-box-containing protein